MPAETWVPPGTGVALGTVGVGLRIGFTFGLSFATAVFPAGPTLVEVKVGAPLTVAGSLVATTAAWRLGAGHFRPWRTV